MDLLQIHNLVDWRTHTATLQHLKATGRVRYIGITHYHAGAYVELEKVLRTGSFDFVQLNYSLAEREAEEHLLPLAQERAVAVIVNRPFAQSALFARVRRTPLPDWAAEFECTSFAQLFLKYVLSHPAITCVIPATRDPVHLHENLQGGGRPPAGSRQAPPHRRVLRPALRADRSRPGKIMKIMILKPVRGSSICAKLICAHEAHLEER